MSRPLLMNVFFPLCFVARTIPRLVKTGSHNVHPLTLRQHAGFPVELLNMCVCKNDKLRLGESWEGYEAFCE